MVRFVTASKIGANMMQEMGDEGSTEMKALGLEP